MSNEKRKTFTEISKKHAASCDDQRSQLHQQSQLAVTVNAANCIFEEKREAYRSKKNRFSTFFILTQNQRQKKNITTGLLNLSSM